MKQPTTQPTPTAPPASLNYNSWIGCIVDAASASSIIIGICRKVIMKRNLNLLSLFGFLLLNLTLLSWSSSGPSPFCVAVQDETIKHMIAEKLEPIKEKYKKLPPKGRFGVSAGAGFVSTKLTVKSTIKAAKVTGAAFIISEVLNQVGVLDKVDLPEGGEQFLQSIKRKVTGAVNDCRLAVRKNCSTDKIREAYSSALERDKMGTLGFTTGAVAGLVW